MRTYIATIGAFMVAATLAGTTAACAGQFRVYDSPRVDDGPRQGYGWNGVEERYYRAYLTERRLPYIEFGRLSPREQRGFWEWRRAGGRYRVWDGGRYQDGDRYRDRARDTDRDRGRDRERGSDRDREWDRGGEGDGR
jgi:hypothetical protein